MANTCQLRVLYTDAWVIHPTAQAENRVRHFVAKTGWYNAPCIWTVKFLNGLGNKHLSVLYLKLDCLYFIRNNVYRSLKYTSLVW